MKGIPGPMTVTPVNLKYTYNEYQELHNRSAPDCRNRRVANCLFEMTFFSVLFYTASQITASQIKCDVYKADRNEAPLFSKSS